MDPHDLYGLPLERFTQERNALAKRLRQEGDREEAARVAKLPKPSVAAWAVNQLVRTQNREIAHLFDTGDALEKAQEDLLAGRGEADSLRRAVDSERATLDELTAKARGLLSATGHELSPSSLESVSETLHAAALDRDARERVQDGCLDRELRHIGLGGLTAAAPRKTGTTRAKAPKRESAQASRGAQVKQARSAEAEARRQMEHAEREVRRARERRDRAATELEQAEQALAAAAELRDEALARHQRAKQALEEVGR